MGQQIEFALRQSMHRVVVMLASFLPGVLAFLLALLVLTLVGLGLAAVMRYVLGALRFDERLASRRGTGATANVADWSPGHSPTLLAARATLWFCVLLGVLLGLSAFDASYPVQAPVSVFILPYVTHITGAVLLLLGGTLLARFLARSVLIGAVNAQLQYARFLSLGVKWLVLVLAAAMAVDHLQIGGTIVELAFGILFGGIVLTLSLAIGLGSRELVSRSIEKSIESPFTSSTGNRPAKPEVPTEQRSSLKHF
jgi:hypothetical protein